MSDVRQIGSTTNAVGKKLAPCDHESNMKNQHQQSKINNIYITFNVPILQYSL